MSKIFATYLIETPGDPEQVAQTLARNQSTGTFTAVPGETDDLRARCEIKVRANGTAFSPSLAPASGPGRSRTPFDGPGLLT